jgi:hypothetical protein
VRAVHSLWLSLLRFGARATGGLRFAQESFDVRFRQVNDCTGPYNHPRDEHDYDRRTEENG